MSDKKVNVHKTIFHTTEKSNFILNMTDEKFNRFAGIVLIISFVLIILMSGASELLSAKAQSIGSEVAAGSDGWTKYEGTFMFQLLYDWRFIPNIALGISGILSASIFIIAVIRQTLTKKQIVPCICAGIMFVFMYISSLNSFTDITDYSWFLGYRYGRYEGMLTYLCYILIFMGAVSISSRKTTDKLLNTIMAAGLVQCIWGGLQCIPSFPGIYKSLTYAENGASAYLPSGVTGNPVFFASFIAVCLSLSIIYAVFSQKKPGKIIYSILSLIFSFFLIRTRTLSSLISAGIIIFLFLIIMFISCIKKIKGFKAYALPLILLITGCVSSAVLSYHNGFNLLDGAVIWQDGAIRLVSSGYYTDRNAFDINSITSVYPYMWNKALDYIRTFPVTGLGPDGFILPQMDFSMALGYKSAMTFDRPYNEYLFYAATLGIPFCIGFIGSVIYAVIMAVKSAAGYFKSKTEWLGCALLLACTSYFAITFINTSSATVSPFIWFILGISCATLASEKSKA